jgi:hypothetical protein
MRSEKRERLVFHGTCATLAIFAFPHFATDLSDDHSRLQLLQLIAALLGFVFLRPLPKIREKVFQNSSGLLESSRRIYRIATARRHWIGWAYWIYLAFITVPHAIGVAKVWKGLFLLLMMFWMACEADDVKEHNQPADKDNS